MAEGYRQRLSPHDHDLVVRSSPCLTRWRHDGGKSHAQDGTATISGPVSIVTTLRDYSGISLGLKALRSPTLRAGETPSVLVPRMQNDPFRVRLAIYLIAAEAGVVPSAKRG